MRGYIINESYHSYSLPGSHDPDDMFWVRGSCIDIVSHTGTIIFV